MSIASSAASTRAFLRTAEIAARCGMSKSFFNKARVLGNGPPFVKIGSAVLYDPEEVHAWFSTRRRTSTSDADA